MRAMAKVLCPHRRLRVCWRKNSGSAEIAPNDMVHIAPCVQVVVVE